MSEARPVRVDGLEAHDVDDGVIVYQLVTNRVHYLNPSAAVVFELCTGEHSVSEIAALVGEAWELSEAPDEEVAAVLAQLREEGVISDLPSGAR